MVGDPMQDELKEKGRAMGRMVPIIAAVAAAVAGFLAIYGQLPHAGNREAVPTGGVIAPAAGVQPPSPALAGLNRGKMTTFVFHKTVTPVPALAFKDGSGADRTLGDFKGRVVLLNLWATWCAPCRQEMPALDRLQLALGGKDFEVVALSTDRGGIEKARKFLADTGVTALTLYQDTTGKAGQDLKAFGMPTTLLIDRAGREIGRLIGPAEWDSEDAKALIAAAVKAGG